MHLLRFVLIGAVCGCDVAYLAVDAATTTPVDAAIDAEVEPAIAPADPEPAMDPTAP